MLKHIIYLIFQNLIVSNFFVEKRIKYDFENMR